MVAADLKEGLLTGAALRRPSLLAPALVLAFAGLAQAQPFAVEVTADVLNVRASAMGTVIGQVNRGQRFAATAQQSGWLRISYQGRTAYISASYARRVSAELLTIGQDVNVRTGPSTSYSRIGVAATGQTYVKLGASSGFNLIQFDHRRGYVVAWATRAQGSSSASSTTTTTTTSSSSRTVTGRRMSATAEELEVLARIVKGEAAQCSFEGKVAVAAVVLNRVRHPRFPNTIKGVAHQPYQFSCYNPNVRNRLYWGAIPQACWDAARAALDGQDPSWGSTYYFNPYLVRPSWARTLRFMRRIGTNRTNTHDFYAIP